MKLATLHNGTRDGALHVVSRDLVRAVAIPEIAATLQHALDDWTRCAPALAAIYDELNASHLPDAQPFDQRAARAPLPRAYQWADGSAYVNHVELVRRARGATMPQEFWIDPLMYQGASDHMLGACEDIVLADDAWGIDFEAEVAVVTGDVPMTTTADAALAHIRLVMLANDVSLRNLIPAELAKGFGRDRGKQRLSVGKMPVGRGLRDPELLGERADVDGFRAAVLGLLQSRLDQGIAEIAMVVGIERLAGEAGHPASRTMTLM